ncbi:MAG: AAA family ATPase [Alphaproteobacteria bacterium]|nr:AAA family ATPase [Alphaproteobacteria bacterium]
MSLEFGDNAVLARVVGPHNKHLAEIERKLAVEIAHRGNRLTVSGPAYARAHAGQVLRDLYLHVERGNDVASGDVDDAVRLSLSGEKSTGNGTSISTPRRVIRGRTKTQNAYLDALLENDLVFGFGPAGTGKTYLAVAVGVMMLTRGEIERLVLSRPAVEAGERLGFLPGDMKEKVDPYLQPLYDALHDMLPAEQIERRMAIREIEVAPLAFMRGRTLANSFVILDEAQNATTQQMKMVLTRLGENSRMAVTGDPSQTDLPPNVASGLHEARIILRDVEGVAMVEFGDEDVVRHPLVRRIVRAYAAHDAARGDKRRP